VTRRPRILLTAQRLPPWQRSGRERAVAGLARTLLARDVDVKLLTTRFEPEQPLREELEGVEVTRLPTLPGPLLKVTQLGFMSAWVTRHAGEFDVVHAHSLSASTLGVVLGARARGVPVVVTPSLGGPRGEIAKLRDNPVGRELLHVLLEVDAFVVIHDDIEAELLDAGVPAERLHRIGNGVDLERFRPATTGERAAEERRLDLPPGARALFVGQLIERKNVELLLSSWARRPSASGASLLLVGDGPLGPLVQRAERERSDVRWLGPRDDVARVARCADVFVLPSRREGFSNALLEALASGLPAVTTAAATPRELPLDSSSDEQRAGFVVPPEPEPLAAALCRLLDDDDLRERCGRQARTLAASHGLGRVARAHLDLYRGLANTKK
jgi:glycosyltransferase involved in cell wall biosynthesis